MAAGGAGRPPPWRDVRVLRAAAQLVFAALVVGLVVWLYGNITANLAAQGLRGGYAFLGQPAGFGIPGSPFRPSQTVLEALLVGVRNTAAVAVVGIVLTTMVGVVVGVARLSANWLVRTAAAIYVETLRNIPPLLVIFVVFFALLLPLPIIQEAVNVGGVLVLSNRELAVVSLVAGPGAGAFVGALVAAGVAALAVGAWRTRRWNRTGRPHHRLGWGAAVVAGVAVVAYAALGAPVTLSRPRVDGLVVAGGVSMIASYAALLVGLVLYTASHVAEIVRGSIQAVPRGQTEAALALGLGDATRLRYVVLPQAFRIALPPIINQYLNLAKNSSLGIAIAFPELTQITFVTIASGNPAPQAIAVLMLLYLAISLLISAVANVANRRLQLVER